MMFLVHVVSFRVILTLSKIPNGIDGTINIFSVAFVSVNVRAALCKLAQEGLTCRIVYDSICDLGTHTGLVL